MPRGKPKPKTLPLPAVWKDKFKSATLRTNFILSLSRPMMEFICACADDVYWDREKFGGHSIPDCFITTSRCLEKRGLIYHVGEEECYRQQITGEVFQGLGFWKLTPAGEKVVELLKLAGLFIEADSAIEKKAKG